MDRNIFRTTSLSPEIRKKALGQNGLVVWFTGLSGSGKSTVAGLCEKRLIESGHPVYLLDGDNLRHGLCSDLGFSPSDREENIRRISETASLMADAGLITLVSAISPNKTMRSFARSKSPSFIEVYVNTPLDICESRDVKGLYAKARSGLIAEFTGISSPYEPPDDPEIILDTGSGTPDECADIVLDYITLKMADLDKILVDCRDIAISAGKIIMDVYSGNFDVEYKDDLSPLTAADTRSHNYICGRLRELYPGFAIISEEGNDDPSRFGKEFCFIIDPLDGTKEFVGRNGEFTVNIGLSYKSKPILGVIYVPVSGDIYYAAKNCGAYKNGSKIAVSDRISSIRAMISRSHGDETMKIYSRHYSLNRSGLSHSDIISEIIPIGSSMKGCLIAEGLAEIYYAPTPFTKEWDICAQDAIVREAGGYLFSGDGAEMKYNRIKHENEHGFYIINNKNNDLGEYQ